MTVPQDLTAAQLTGAIQAVNSVIATTGRLENGSPTILANIYQVVQSALAPYQAALAAFEADLIQTSVGGVVTGIPAPMLGPILLNQASDIQQEWLVILAAAYLKRVASNVTTFPG